MNQFRDYLRAAPLFTQGMVLFAVALLGAGLLGAMGLLAAETFFGADVATIEKYLAQPEGATAIATLKVLQIFTTAGLFLIPAMVFSQLFSPQPTLFLRLSNPVKPLLLVAAAVLFVAFIPVTDALTYLNQSVHLPAFLSEYEAGVRAASERTQVLIGSFLEMNSLGAFAFNLFLLAILPAFAEEFFFRGVLQELIVRKTRNMHLAVWVSALGFGLMHNQLFSVLPLVFLGAMLGYLKEWTGSLWPSIIAHFVNNGSIVVIMYFGQLNMTDIEAMSTPEAVWLVPSLLVSAMLIFWLWRQRTERHTDDEDLPAPEPEDYSGM
jgi:membrane protease YdiL (CAAX protease family)